MFEEVILGLLDLVIIATIALVVFLTVQGLKVYGFVTEGNEGKVALGAALGMAILLAAGEIFPAAMIYVVMFIRFWVAGLVAGLFYKYIAKPVVEAFVGNITTKDLQ